MVGGEEAALDLAGEGDPEVSTAVTRGHFSDVMEQACTIETLLKCTLIQLMDGERTRKVRCGRSKSLARQIVPGSEF